MTSSSKATRSIWLSPDHVTLSPNLVDASDNPRYEPTQEANISGRLSRNCFVCGACDSALHFERLTYSVTCSVCFRWCHGMALVCDTCGLFICCGASSANGQVQLHTVGDICCDFDCYSSYFHATDELRERLYGNTTQTVSEFGTDDQQLWLQCMWHDIVNNTQRFQRELYHASQVEYVDASSSNIIVENLSLVTTQRLIRLLIVFQSKLCTNSMTWLSNLLLLNAKLGYAALNTAVCHFGRLDTVKWLIDEMNVNPASCNPYPTLGYAAMRGVLESVEYLLGDDRVDPSADANCAIRFACENGHLSVVERLLQDDRVDPSADDNYAIRSASEKGHVNVVERLLQDNRVNPSAENNYALCIASYNDDIRVVERLLQDARVDPSTGESYAFRIACGSGNIRVVERLLEDHRVDAAAKNNSAIGIACCNGNVEVVERLLQEVRVDPSVPQNYALQMASEQGHLSVVERLLQDDRVDPSAVDNEAIRRASGNGHLGVVERLLQDGRVDPSASHNDALRRASCNGHARVVARLLQDPRTSAAAMENFAIQYASGNGHLRVVELLLQDEQVDPSANDNNALCLASMNGRLSVVDRLLQDERVDPSANHSSALRLASKEGRLGIVKLLLEDGRVNACANQCEAIVAAKGDEVLKCLYDHAARDSCFMFDNKQLMRRLTPLHRESLITGGLCLSFTRDTTVGIPNDIVIEVLSLWATLMV